MAFSLPKDQRGQVMALLIIVAWVGAYFYWSKIHTAAHAQVVADHVVIDSLNRVIQTAKADLASGSIEDLRRRVAEYQKSLGVMRTLVPEQNEVPTLLDEINTRAKMRGVVVDQFQPLSDIPGTIFDTKQYHLTVYGHYDQVGEFLADVASLPRIMVPEAVGLSPAQQSTERALGDTTGGLLEATMTLKTYVKAAPPPAPKGKANAHG